MPEFRRNPLTGDWVLYAEERAARPNDFRAPGDQADCPFCPGNEWATPPEIVADRPADTSPDSPGWRWRIFPNKFPALSPALASQRAVRLDRDRHVARGYHEVLVETPRHGASLADLANEEAAAALGACKARITVLQKQPGVRYVLVFKNHGQGSGASLRHPHFQIIALNRIPKRVQLQLNRARLQFQQTGGCTLCRMIAQERLAGARLIHASHWFVIFAPAAGRFPGETWIVPARHSVRFDDIPGQALGELGAVLRTLVGALRAWAGDAPYNLLLHTPPPGLNGDAYFHWRIELLPRIGGVAGFEWATGIHVNQVTPEEAARRLRENWGR